MGSAATAVKGSQQPDSKLYPGPESASPVRSSRAPENPPESRRIVISLGSNQGQREQHLHFAISRLNELLGELRVSKFVETSPVDVPPQRDFLNAVAIGLSVDSSKTLLRRLLYIEAERGRTRTRPGAPRPLDLDLILVGDEILTSTELTVPHPHFRKRRFVLEPLCEISPTTRDPVTTLCASELLERIS